MFKASLVTVVLFASASYAAPLLTVDNAFDCDQMINSLVGGANVTMEGGFDPILTVENGRAKINKESKRIVSFKSDAKTVSVTFLKKIMVNGKMETVKETVEYEVNDQGYIVNYHNDENAVKKYDPMRRYGTKNRLKKNGDNCSVDQFSTTLGMPDGSTVEVVNQDKKYCDSVKDIMAQMDKKSYNQCDALLSKAADAYLARAQELGKENKKFVGLGEGPANAIATTLQALNTCGPDEWYDKAMTPMGTMRTLKAVPAEKAKKSSAGSSKKKGTN